jgi:peptidoglycan/LPS O-acetylase OafA/YrhL
MRRIDSLDGFRALSIVMVICGHFALEWEARHGTYPFWTRFVDAGLGVFIFFVISGYLITLLLLKEFERRGSLSLRRFYFRRFFRIVPPLYLYILFIAITAPLSGLRAEPRELLTALTFTRNLDPHAHQFMFQHFWSLCIEEQFYLLWPVALLIALRHSGRTGATRLALVLIIVAPIYRVVAYLAIPQLALREYAYGLLPGHMDALMFGCWGALAEGTLPFERIYQKATAFSWILPVWLFGVSQQLSGVLHNYYRLTIGDTLDGVATLFMLLWAIRTPGTLAWKVLNWRPIVHIGVISYSIYIWQTYFLHPQNSTIFGRFPYNLVCILVAAEFSWWTVERFSRKLRDWAEARLRPMGLNREPLTGNEIGPMTAVPMIAQQKFDPAVPDGVFERGELS